MEISQPFIRLPFAFEAERLAEEVTALPESAWMSHPSGLRGNSAVALVSREGGDNDDFEGTMLETPHLQACPYIRQVMAGLDAVFGRSRLMKLAPGAEVSQHVDFNYHWYTRVRIHVPVITNPGVMFYCADQRTHMKAGECWIFDAWRRHRVTNESNEHRVHLILDTAGSSRFWTMVRKMGQSNYPIDAAEIAALVKTVPFRQGAEVTIRTEKYNIAPVMSPGEVDALVDGLIRDFQDNPENDAAIVDEYKTLYEGYEPEDARYLSVHRGHLMIVRPEEEHLIGGDLIKALSFTATAPELRERIHELSDAGYSQISFHISYGQDHTLEEWADLVEGI